MTNPGSIVRVRARNGGRASVYEANGWAQGFTAGLLDGNGVIQNTSANMNVLVGGSTTKPDVVLATNPSGYRIALDLVGQQAVAITAPASNSRITSIVAYTNDLAVASTQTTTTGSPATCGLIAVNGSASASPVEPSDATIRSAITADGGTGSQACYCVIANILVASTTTAITNSLITIKNSVVKAKIEIPDNSISSNKLNWQTMETSYLEDTNFAIETSSTKKCGYNVQATGKYLVIANLLTNGLGTLHAAYLQIYKNSSQVTQSYNTVASSSLGNLSVSAIVDCANNETISIGVQDSIGIPVSPNNKVSATVIRVA